MGPVKSVYALTDTLVHRMETEDVAVAVLRFASGALGTIAATTGAYPGSATRIEVFGDKGSAIIETAPGAVQEIAQNPAALSSSSHALQIADMIRAIREDRTPLVDGYAGRRPVEIILSIYESARTHREVVLP